LQAWHTQSPLPGISATFGLVTAWETRYSILSAYPGADEVLGRYAAFAGLGARLRHEVHDAAHANELFMNRSADSEILQSAAHTGRGVITCRPGLPETSHRTGYDWTGADLCAAGTIAEPRARIACAAASCRLSSQNWASPLSMSTAAESADARSWSDAGSSDSGPVPETEVECHGTDPRVPFPGSCAARAIQRVDYTLM
jgi:hypothetical protein